MLNHKSKRKLIFAFITLTLFFLTIGLLSCMSTKPENLGITNNQLHPCPNKPNCVCSFSSPENSQNAIPPYKFTGSTAATLLILKQVLSELPRTKIITESENYLHVECTSFLFRFVDDLEILLDDQQKLIHFRSASRVGYSDLGVNRQRVELIKEKLSQLQKNDK